MAKQQLETYKEYRARTKSEREVVVSMYCMFGIFGICLIVGAMLGWI